MKPFSSTAFADAGTQGRPGWLTVRAQAAGHVEMLIVGQIGKNWWDDSGVSEKEFTDALAKIPADTRITVGINSEGGSVKDGLGIYNALKRRGDKITTRCDGYAASIASVLMLAGAKRISPKSCIWMIHEPWNFSQGNASEHRKAADMLDAHAETLVSIYVEASGKTPEAIRSDMQAEKWIKGSEAKAYGFATDESEDDVVLNTIDLSRFRNVPTDIAAMIRPKTPTASAGSGGHSHHQNPPNPTPVMNRKQLEAFAKKLGLTFDASISDVDLAKLVENYEPPKAQTTPPPPKADDTAAVALAEIKAMRERLEREDNERITRAVDQCLAECRITAQERPAALARALKDPTYVTELQARPENKFGAEPIEAMLEGGQESPRDLLKQFGAFSEPTKAWQNGKAVDMQTISASSIARAHFLSKNRARLAPVMNANTIATELKRNFILQTVIEDFARKTLMLGQFSTVFRSVPLEGTNKVEVPFLDLDSTSPTSFVTADGYNTVTGTAVDKREIQVGNNGGNAALLCDRRYAALSFTSEEMARQPFLKVLDHVRRKADGLASSVVNHVLSVVTAANYGAAAKTEPAGAFDSDDLIDIKLACKLWPDMGRSLFLDSAYDANLLKDTSFKHALNAASDSAIKEGRLYPRVLGFDYIENPTIPDNGENLVGFAAHAAAILVATAPVPPVEEVRRAGCSYEVFTHPLTGITFEFRTFGDTTLDSATQVIELNYGFAVGNANALKRITSA